MLPSYQSSPRKLSRIADERSEARYSDLLVSSSSRPPSATNKSSRNVFPVLALPLVVTVRLSLLVVPADWVVVEPTPVLEVGAPAAVDAAALEVEPAAAALEVPAAAALAELAAAALPAAYINNNKLLRPRCSHKYIFIETRLTAAPNAGKTSSNGEGCDVG